MKKVVLLLLASFAIASLMVACGGKADPAKIDALDTYTNTTYKFEIKFPKNWSKTSQPSRLVVFSSKNDAARFYKYDDAGSAGAKIEFYVEKIDSSRTFEDFMKNAKLLEESAYSTAVDVQVGGITAKKQTYEFELTDGMFKGEVYYAMQDSGICNALFFEAFGGTFDALKPKFDEMLASVKWARSPQAKTADTIFQEVEADPPSESFRNVSGDGYSIDVPENFSREKGFFIGQRRGDSYIRVDVIDLPANANFDKTIENARKSVSGTAPQEISLGGQKGKVFNYKPTSQISGELYFVRKANKLYRITVNWFSGNPDEEKLFKPILQKSVRTFKLN